MASTKQAPQRRSTPEPPAASASAAQREPAPLAGTTDKGGSSAPRGRSRDIKSPCRLTTEFNAKDALEATRDERTVFENMSAHRPWGWRPDSTNDPDLRTESVTAALNRMVDGKPGFVLSQNCATLRKGFSGGYHYKRVHAGTVVPSFHEAPAKDHYSHIHDTLQHAMLAMGGAEAVLHRADRGNRPRMAEGIDFTLLDRGEDTPRTTPGVRWGNPPYSNARQQRRVVFARQDDGDEW